MLLLCMTVCFVLFGSSAGIELKEVCFGKQFSLPLEYTAPIFRGKVYFTPKKGGSRKLLIDNGKLQVEDPRIKIDIGSVTFTDLKHSDAGIISILTDGLRRRDVIRLSILDCHDSLSRNFGERITVTVPRDAEFLEFSPYVDGSQPQVLWNRTNPQTNRAGRGKLKRNVWEITSLTPSDIGFYTFRKKDNMVTYRMHLFVEAEERVYHPDVGELIAIENPPFDGPWNLTFTSEHDPDEEILLVKAGILARENYYSPNPFKGRIQVVHRGIEIDPVESKDSGLFRFKDSQDNVHLIVYFNVKPQHFSDTLNYVGVFAGVFISLIFCCCCVRKCCCKKSSSKRDEPAPAPAVYDHLQDQNQPAGPSYSAAPAPDYSSLPSNPPVPKEPPTYSPAPVHHPVNIHVNPPQPEVHHPVNIHVNPPQPEVAAAGGHGAASAFSLDSDYLLAGADPKFELKGLKISSAAPLSSDSDFCHVYTSDKLNFL